MVDGNTVNINNPISCYNASKKEEQEIKGIIADLRSVIDQFSLNKTSARDLIQELARRLDESEQCEQGQICKRIKEILNDKIQERKITEKWIEECLPKEYKRKYVKSELSSLSNNPETILVSSQGKTITGPNAEPAYDNIKIKNPSTCHNCELLQSENLQLREALENKTQLISADKLLENVERKFVILKRDEAEIINALQNCNKNCNIVFSSDGILARIEPDTLQESDDVEKET